MADTPALGAGAARHGGSSPLPRTKNRLRPIFAWEESSRRALVRT